MHIEQAQSSDLPILMKIFDGAKIFMAENGNPTQWPPGYPTESTVQQHIDDRDTYILKEDGIILATFYLPFGPDPTYQVICGPGWLNGEKYGTIHQVAVNQQLQRSGLGTACLRAAETLAHRRGVRNLRIDTHPDNIPMQRTIVKNGYTYCGVITVQNGSNRYAYHKVLNENN